MKRKEFVRSSGLICGSLVLTGPFLGGCSGINAIQTSVVDGMISIPKSEFITEKGKAKRYVLIKASLLDFPIVIYRKSGDSYRAYLLQCTHQGTQLNVHGDLISCPAHGSEFSNFGSVINGPAISSLQEFVVISGSNSIQLKIS